MIERYENDLTEFEDFWDDEIDELEPTECPMCGGLGCVNANSPEPKSCPQCEGEGVIHDDRPKG